MKSIISQSLFWVYLGILIPLNLSGHFFDIPNLVYFSKPLLMPLLVVLFSLRIQGNNSSIKKGVLGALFFSWIGDLALMIDSQNSLFFIVGLVGFLIAHIHYVFVFNSTREKTKKASVLRKILIPGFIVYGLGFIYILWPNLGELKIPVAIYATVLMLMGVFAVSRKESPGFNWVLLGALLFVISDSVLAINKFHNPFESARVITMLTYTLAQLFLVLGLSKYINSKS